MAQESMFEAAHEQTLTMIEQFIIQKKVSRDQLNLAAKQVFLSAKMELFAAQSEGITVDRLSQVARQILENPEITPSEFEIIDNSTIIETPVKEETKENHIKTDQIGEEIFESEESFTKANEVEPHGDEIFTVVDKNGESKTNIKSGDTADTIEKEASTSPDTIQTQEPEEANDDFEIIIEKVKKDHSKNGRAHILKTKIVLDEDCVMWQSFALPSKEDAEKFRKAESQNKANIPALETFDQSK